MEYLLTSVLIIVLLVLAWIDFKTFLLPDFLTIPLMCLGLISIGLGWLDWTSFTSSIFGALAGWGSLYLLNLLYQYFKGIDGIGMGDAKLLAALGAFLGWESLPYILLIASVTGLIGGAIWLKVHHQDNSHVFPFGPFIALGGIITVLWQILQPTI
jgi:prepilin signal peptidase PulO-like enzyme (type II secretory pathway)